MFLTLIINALDLQFKFPSASFKGNYITGSNTDTLTGTRYNADLMVETRVSAKCSNGVVSTKHFEKELKLFRSDSVTQYRIGDFTQLRICGPSDVNPQNTKIVYDMYFHTENEPYQARCIGEWNYKDLNGLGQFTIIECAWQDYNSIFMKPPVPNRSALVAEFLKK